MSTKFKNILPITHKHLCYLYFYFFILSILSLLIALYAILLSYDNTSIPYINIALMGSSACGVLGCSLNYIRKLYKTQLSDHFKYLSPHDEDFHKSMATVFYFISRPIFSIAFVLLFILGFKTGLLSISNGTNELNNTFCDITMFFSLFIGFATGAFLKLVQHRATEIVESTLSNTK